MDKNRHGIEGSNIIVRKASDYLMAKIESGEFLEALWKNYEYLSDKSSTPDLLKEHSEYYISHIITEQYLILQCFTLIFQSRLAECSGKLFLKMLKKFNEENFFGVVSKKMISIDAGNTVPMCVHYLSQFMLISALNIESLKISDARTITNKTKAPLKIFIEEGQGIFDELLTICDTDASWTKYKSISILGTAILRTCDILTALVHNIKETTNNDVSLTQTYKTLTDINEYWQNHNCEFYTLTQLDYVEPIDELFKSNLYKYDSSFFQNFIRNSLKDFLNVCINTTEMQRDSEFDVGLFWLLDDNAGHEFFAKVISNIFKNPEECYQFHRSREALDGRSYTSGYNKIIDNMLEDFPENNNITQVLLQLCGNKKQNFTIETFMILSRLEFYTVKLNTSEWKDKMAYDQNRKISITTDRIVLDNGEIIPAETPFT